MKKAVIVLILSVFMLLVSFQGCIENINFEKSIEFNKMEPTIKSGSKVMDINFSMKNVDAVNLALMGPNDRKRDKKESVLKNETGVYLSIGESMAGVYKIVSTHKSDIIDREKKRFNGSELEFENIEYHYSYDYDKSDYATLRLSQITVSNKGDLPDSINKVSIQADGLSSNNEYFFENIDVNSSTTVSGPRLKGLKPGRTYNSTISIFGDNQTFEINKTFSTPERNPGEVEIHSFKSVFGDSYNNEPRLEVKFTIKNTQDVKFKFTGPNGSGISKTTTLEKSRSSIEYEIRGFLEDDFHHGMYSLKIFDKGVMIENITKNFHASVNITGVDWEIIEGYEDVDIDIDYLNIEITGNFFIYISEVVVFLEETNETKYNYIHDEKISQEGILTLQLIDRFYNLNYNSTYSFGIYVEKDDGSVIDSTTLEITTPEN